MATPSFSYSLPQIFTFPFEALEERAPPGGAIIFLQQGLGEIKKVVCPKVRAFPCFDLEEVRLWDVKRHQRHDLVSHVIKETSGRTLHAVFTRRSIFDLPDSILSMHSLDLDISR